MINEKTMRKLSNCKQVAEQLNEEFNNLLENIRVSELNIHVKVSNLQQSTQDRAVLMELDKYLQTSVYEPLTKSADFMEQFVIGFKNLQVSEDKEVSSSLKTLLGFAKKLIPDLKMAKVQAKRLQVNFEIQNANIRQEMSDDIARIEGIVKASDDIFKMLYETASTIETVLMNI